MHPCTTVEQKEENQQEIHHKKHNLFSNVEGPGPLERKGSLGWGWGGGRKMGRQENKIRTFHKEAAVAPPQEEPNPWATP